MRIYAAEYSQAALDALLAGSSRRRIDARSAIEQLCRNLSKECDFTVRDDSGRMWNVILFDGVVLTYWIDHAVCEVKIGLVEWVD